MKANVYSRLIGFVVSGFRNVLCKIINHIKTDKVSDRPLGEGIVITDCGVLQD